MARIALSILVVVVVLYFAVTGDVDWLLGVVTALLLVAVGLQFTPASGRFYGTSAESALPEDPPTGDGSDPPREQFRALPPPDCD
jgi:Ca2+/Na+ antiporter